MLERVVPDVANPGAWVVRINGIDHSWIDPDDPTRLEFDYMQRIATHLDLHAPEGERLRIVHVGGAGMSLARYVTHTRPTSAQIVCEPDTALTDEVRDKVPLPRNSGVKVRPVDGRTGLSQMPMGYADVVIVDAFAGTQVPGDLATVEWFAQVRQVLVGGGLFVMNVTDGGPLVWTRRLMAGVTRYFPHPSLTAESATLKGRRFGNVVIAGSGSPLPVAALVRRAAGAPFPYRLVTGERLTEFIGNAQPFHDGQTAPSPEPGHRTFFS